MVNKNILKVRKTLDKLDNKLLEIIKKRVKHTLQNVNEQVKNHQLIYQVEQLKYVKVK